MPFLVYGAHGDLEDFLVICLKLTPHAHVKGLQALTNESIFSQAVSGVPCTGSLILHSCGLSFSALDPVARERKVTLCFSGLLVFSLYQLLWTSQFT